MEIPFVNTYFNFDDFNSPVKTYIDGRLTFDLLPGYLIRNDVFIQKNEAEYLDSYFAYQPGGTKKEFVGVDRVDQRLAVQHDSVSETIFKMQFVKDEATKSFERTVFSFMEAFGNIGGLFEIMEIAGGLFVGVFSGRMFLFTILSHLYQIETPDDGEEINHRSKSIRMTGQNIDSSRNLSLKDSPMQHQNLISKQKMIEKAHQRMRSLVRYDYSFMDFLFSILTNIPCLFVCCCRSKNRLHLKKRNALFNKGGDKFVKEFDAVRYAKSMREVQTLLKSMIDDKERFIIPYQKCNSIAMHSESDSGNEDDNYAKVPKMFTEYIFLY